MKIVTILIATLFLSQLSCTSKPTIYPRNPLSQQILRVRAGYPEKLTNSACMEYKGEFCTDFPIIVYDMNDANFRSKANEFGMKCDIAGKRFRICMDKAGFCRSTEKCVKHTLLFWCNLYEEIYIPAKEHQYLLDANTKCKK